MDIQSYCQENFLIFDGAIGTILQREGALKLGGHPNLLNLENPELILNIHKRYLEAGSQVVTTNTFEANRVKLEGTGASVEEVIQKGIQIAKQAVKEVEADAWVALDVGPIGQLLKPMGTLSFDDAYDIYRQQVVVGQAQGADLILFETMTDLMELKAAVLAAKENTTLPIFATMTFEETGRTFTGCTIESMACVLEGLGVDAIGFNCSMGAKQLFPLVKKLTKLTALPIMVQPNAGMPREIEGQTVYDMDAATFGQWMGKFADLGVSILGGCCGTDFVYIRAIKQALAEKDVSKKREIPSKSCVCTASKMVNIDDIRVIGERLNPTGKKMLKQALLEHDMDYIMKQAVEQVEAGADILDVNVGLPDINEPQMMKEVVEELQGVVDVPLQIDSSDARAVEVGLRYFGGKAIVNSVNGEQKSLHTILPLVKKYGAMVVGLTLDEAGIPETVEGRLEIAKGIIQTAAEYGISRENIIIDCLVLTASAQQAGAAVTLESLRRVKEELGVKTVLGVSNVSFGLPRRDLINSTFLAMALQSGLDLPIMNPNLESMMNVVRTARVLKNLDIDAREFISCYGDTVASEPAKSQGEDDLKKIVIQGLEGEAGKKTVELLKDKTELEIVDEYLIPALDVVGERYEKGQLFLPQLIKSAATVQKAFEEIKKSLVAGGKKSISKGTIVLATVKGDIHDIGKNIVKVILENYGYTVVDLGKDVPAEAVVEAAKKPGVQMVGLSALMTTTVKSMKETIEALKVENCPVKTVVGGAVLNPEYAQDIGADYYAKDAKEAVNIARKIFGQ